MRELPEPEGYLCDWGNDSYGLPRIIVYYGEPGSATEDDWNESPKVHRNTPIFTRDQVLAIQKQAYEDGLRDAPEGYVLAPKEPTTSMIDAGFYEPTHPATSAVKVARVYEAMLTASQKEQQ